MVAKIITLFEREVLDGGGVVYNPTNSFLVSPETDFGPYWDRYKRERYMGIDYEKYFTFAQFLSYHGFIEITNERFDLDG